MEYKVIIRRKSYCVIGKLCLTGENWETLKSEENSVSDMGANEKRLDNGNQPLSGVKSALDSQNSQTITEQILFSLKPSKSNFVASEDGKKVVAVHGKDGTTGACARVYDVQSEQEIGSVGNYVAQVIFSPKGTFLETWSRFQENSDSDVQVNPGCVTIWRTDNFEKIASFHAKNFVLECWPLVQWTQDETLAFRASSTQLFVYNGDKLDDSPIQKIILDNFKVFVASPVSSPCYIGTFTPPRSSTPAKIAIWNASAKENKEPIAVKSMFRADSVRFLWNKGGAALLSWVSSDSDSSGKSYYGESFLYYCNPGKSSEFKQIDLPRKGPIQDVCWSPDGKQFIIVYGSMPARATLFNWLCEPLFDFGTGTRNTISFSPHGRFLCFGGFGNLPGDLEFWDRKRRQLLGRTSAPCTTASTWSPDSRYFLAATTFPRLRVDNGFQIFRYDGTLIGKVSVPDELYQLEFLPAEPTKYPDLPSPHIAKNNVAIDNRNQTTPSENIYRPPALRGKKVAVSFHQDEAPRALDTRTWILETKQSGQVQPQSVKKTVVGAPPEEEEETLSKRQRKNKKKKEKTQQKKDTESQENPNAFQIEEDLPPSVKKILEKKSASLQKKKGENRVEENVEKLVNHTSALSIHSKTSKQFKS
eukprot:jgi/Galph1/88/GphlegSOOS_G4783.1